MVYIRWFILGVNKINFLPSYKNMENYISRNVVFHVFIGG